MTEAERTVIEQGSKTNRLSIAWWVLLLWAFVTSALAGLATYYYLQNLEITKVPVFIYAGPNVPQEIVDRVNIAMNSFDEKIIEEWYKDKVYDSDFQMAMFYSYLSLALAERANVTKNTYADDIKRDVTFRKSVDLWAKVVKKDGELIVFRDYLINRYRKTLKND